MSTLRHCLERFADGFLWLPKFVLRVPDAWIQAGVNEFVWACDARGVTRAQLRYVWSAVLVMLILLIAALSTRRSMGVTFFCIAFALIILLGMYGQRSRTSNLSPELQARYDDLMAGLPPEPPPTYRQMLKLWFAYMALTAGWDYSRALHASWVVYDGWLFLLQYMHEVPRRPPPKPKRERAAVLAQAHS